MFARQEIPVYSFETYLKMEEQAEYKSEYHAGQIVAMAGASFSHNRIVSNLHGNIYDKLPDSCDVLVSDLRVWIEKKQMGTYPDVLVVCGEPEFWADRQDTITNPRLIIEVLSASTASYDRGDKFYAYWSLPSLQEYVLIDQYEPRVEYFRRQDEKTWQLRVFSKMEERLVLHSLDVEISLAEIYRRVVWPSPTDDPPESQMAAADDHQHP